MIGLRERCVEQKARDQIGIGNERLAECNQVCSPFCNRLYTARPVVAIVRQVNAAERALDRAVIERRNRRSRRVAFDYVQIGEALVRQLLRDIVEQRLRIAVLPVLRRDADDDALRASVYPQRKYLSPKVRSFIEFFANRFGPEPYWDRF